MSNEIITRPVSTPCPVCGSCDVEGFVVKETETLFMKCYECGLALLQSALEMDSLRLGVV